MNLAALKEVLGVHEVVEHLFKILESQTGSRSSFGGSNGHTYTVDGSGGLFLVVF